MSIYTYFMMKHQQIKYTTNVYNFAWDVLKYYLSHAHLGTNANAYPNKSQCVCTWFGQFWSDFERMQKYDARKQTTTKMLCFFDKEEFPACKKINKSENANHIVVQSQPGSSPGCILPGGKVETLEDMPGNENCIETPLSQLVQWAE